MFKRPAFRAVILCASLAGAVVGLSACGRSPLTRGVTGGLLGAGAGAGVGAITGVGAGTGALIGGGVGAVGGAATAH